MNKKWISFLVVFVSLLMLTGCMYPDDRRAQNLVNPQEFVLVVQGAVNTYRSSTGLLPIKNSELTTPIYEKYVIDFKKLLDRGYLSQIPSNAFENGGTNFYVLIHVETNPTVKLMDMLPMQQASEIQRLVNDYISRNEGRIPSETAITDHWYSINYSLLGKDRSQVKSVYSNLYLSMLVHTSGKVIIDYGPEIMKLIQRLELTDIEPNLDLRTLLVEHSYFVPGQSHPYFWVEDRPYLSDVMN